MPTPGPEVYCKEIFEKSVEFHWNPEAPEGEPKFAIVLHAVVPINDRTKNMVVQKQVGIVIWSGDSETEAQQYHRTTKMIIQWIMTEVLDRTLEHFNTMVKENQETRTNLRKNRIGNLPGGIQLIDGTCSKCKKFRCECKEKP